MKSMHLPWGGCANGMELIDNVSKTLKDDLLCELQSGSKVSIAASCFSIYAFEQLKAQLKDIKEVRFIGMRRMYGFAQ